MTGMRWAVQILHEGGWASLLEADDEDVARAVFVARAQITASSDSYRFVSHDLDGDRVYAQTMVPGARP